MNYKQKSKKKTQNIKFRTGIYNFPTSARRKKRALSNNFLVEEDFPKRPKTSSIPNIREKQIKLTNLSKRKNLFLRNTIPKNFVNYKLKPHEGELDYSISSEVNDEKVISAFDKLQKIVNDDSIHKNIKGLLFEDLYQTSLYFLNEDRIKEKQIKELKKAKRKLENEIEIIKKKEKNDFDLIIQSPSPSDFVKMKKSVDSLKFEIKKYKKDGFLSTDPESNEEKVDIINFTDAKILKSSKDKPKKERKKKKKEKKKELLIPKETFETFQKEKKKKETSETYLEYVHEKFSLLEEFIIYLKKRITIIEQSDADLKTMISEYSSIPNLLHQMETIKSENKKLLWVKKRFNSSFLLSPKILEYKGSSKKEFEDDQNFTNPHSPTPLSSKTLSAFSFPKTQLQPTAHVSSPNSSNYNNNKKSYLIDSDDDLDRRFFKGIILALQNELFITQENLKLAIQTLKNERTTEKTFKNGRNGRNGENGRKFSDFVPVSKYPILPNIEEYWPKKFSTLNELLKSTINNNKNGDDSTVYDLIPKTKPISDYTLREKEIYELYQLEKENQGKEDDEETQRRQIKEEKKSQRKVFELELENKMLSEQLEYNKEINKRLKKSIEVVSYTGNTGNKGPGQFKLKEIEIIMKKQRNTIEKMMEIREKEIKQFKKTQELINFINSQRKIEGKQMIEMIVLNKRLKQQCNTMQTQINQMKTKNKVINNVSVMLSSLLLEEIGEKRDGDRNRNERNKKGEQIVGQMYRDMFSNYVQVVNATIKIQKWYRGQRERNRLLKQGIYLIKKNPQKGNVSNKEKRRKRRENEMVPVPLFLSTEYNMKPKKIEKKEEENKEKMLRIDRNRKKSTSEKLFQTIKLLQEGNIYGKKRGKQLRKIRTVIGTIKNQIQSSLKTEVQESLKKMQMEFDETIEKIVTQVKKKEEDHSVTRSTQTETKQNQSISIQAGITKLNSFANIVEQKRRPATALPSTNTRKKKRKNVRKKRKI